MKTIIVVILCVWLYRYIGVLLYKIRGARGERSEESSAVSFPEPPNMILYLLWWTVGKKFLSPEWRPRYYSWFFSSPDREWCLMMDYKAVYFWPLIEMKKLYKRYWRRVVYEYHLIRRTADKKLLKEPLFAQLAKDTKRIKGFKLVGVKSTRDGRSDWGWSTTYYLSIRIPKQRWNVLSTATFNRKKEFARESLGAILNLSYHPKSHEITLAVNGSTLKSNIVEGWGRSYFRFLESIAE